MVAALRRWLESKVDALRTSPLGRFVEKYNADRADDFAVLIAWSALFSLFPLVVGLLSILGILFRDPRRLAAVQNVIAEQFPAQAEELLGFLRQTRDLSGLLGIIGLIGLLWAGSALFGSMARAFNRFYGVPDRGFLRQKLMSFLMIAVFLALMLVSVFASALADTLFELARGRNAAPVPGITPAVEAGAAVVGRLITLLSALALFLSIYLVVPNLRLGLRDVWPGAALAAVLYTLLVQAWPLYFRLFGGGFAAYAALGTFLLLVTWLALLGRIVVLGAEINAWLHPGAEPAEVSAEVARQPAEPSVRAARSG